MSAVRSVDPSFTTITSVRNGWLDKKSRIASRLAPMRASSLYAGMTIDRFNSIVGVSIKLQENLYDITGKARGAIRAQDDRAIGPTRWGRVNASRFAHNSC